MITIEKIEEIQETVQEAYDEIKELNCNMLGLYNYIRYANEDFGEDMIINESKLACDNSKIQHYYLVIFMAEGILRGYEIPKDLISLYEDKKSRYNDEKLEQEIAYIEKKYN